MKLRTKIVLCILLVVVIAIGIVVYKNWNSISAFIDSFKYTQEDVQEQLDQNKEYLDNYLTDEGGITVRDLTEEESAALSEGKLTEEEVIEMLIGTIDPTPTPTPTLTPEPADTGKTDVSKPTPTPTPTPPPVSPEVEAAKKKVAEAVAKLYIQKNKYLGKLDDIEAQVLADFIAIEKSDPTMKNKTKYNSVKKEFLTKNLPMVANWEKECDSVVYGIIDEIRAALKESGQSQEIADKLEEAYLSEKKLKKTYFINRYMD